MCCQVRLRLTRCVDLLNFNILGLNFSVSYLQLGTSCSLFLRDSCIIQLDQIRQRLDAVLTIKWMLTDWVVLQPQYPQVRQRCQVADFKQVVNLIFAQEELLDFLAVLEVSQTLDFV